MKGWLLFIYLMLAVIVFMVLTSAQVAESFRSLLKFAFGAVIAFLVIMGIVEITGKS